MKIRAIRMQNVFFKALRITRLVSPYKNSTILGKQIPTTECSDNAMRIILPNVFKLPKEIRSTILLKINHSLGHSELFFFAGKVGGVATGLMSSGLVKPYFLKYL